MSVSDMFYTVGIAGVGGLAEELNLADARTRGMWLHRCRVPTSARTGDRANRRQSAGGPTGSRRRTHQQV